jgi:hypothetical protein
VSGMLPDDMMAALGGAGGGGAMPGGMPLDPMAVGPAGGGGLPPDLMAMLGAGGAPEGQAPPEEQPAGITDGKPGGGEEALTEAINLLQLAIDAEADQEDIQTMLQCQTKLQQVLAKNQAEADKALGGQVTPRAVRRMAPEGV